MAVEFGRTVFESIADRVIVGGYGEDGTPEPYKLTCAYGCKYSCYAYLLKKRFGQIKGYDAWLEPHLVSDMLELLDIGNPRTLVQDVVCLALFYNESVYDRISRSDRDEHCSNTKAECGGYKIYYSYKGIISDRVSRIVFGE